jgi:hypothetical protein
LTQPLWLPAAQAPWATVTGMLSHTFTHIHTHNRIQHPPTHIHTQTHTHTHTCLQHPPAHTRACQAVLFLTHLDQNNAPTPWKKKRANAAIMSRHAGGKASPLFLALKSCAQSKNTALKTVYILSLTSPLCSDLI